MTPAARYAAAIEVLDKVFVGEAAEKVLTTWARQNRFAGSKDRAAIRDHVYAVLRARRTVCALGGGDTGRAAVLGLLRREGPAPDQVFGAGGYGPDGLSPEEARVPTPDLSAAGRVDLPDWLWPEWQDSLGDDAEDVADRLRGRAPVTLRVNLTRATRAAAQTRLRDDGVETRTVDGIDTALVVTENPRRAASSQAFRDGLVELQDAASQAAILQLPLMPGMRVLDACAGGGGKALAMADRIGGPVKAFDVNPARMADIPARADRAGVQIERLSGADLDAEDTFDLVLCDAPCSGSGTWRRTPDAKWSLTSDRLLELNRIQTDILAAFAPRVRCGGYLAYATCSVLRSENDDAVNRFIETNQSFTLRHSLRLLPDDDHDGFYLAIMHRQ